MSELLKLLLGAAFSLLATLLVALLAPLWQSQRHRNYILFSVFLFCMILTFYFSGFFSGWILFILLALLVSYIFVAYYAATRPIFPETSAIAQLANLVREGSYTEIEKQFSQRPFYIRSISGKIKWNLLWARKLMTQEQPRLRDAYEMYSELLSLPLFKKEENNIRLNQVLALFLLGDTNKAKSIFERTKQKIDQDKYYEILYLQSLFDERAGEFEKARQSLLSAVGEHDNVKDIQLARIYNNLGRMEKLLGNTTNTSHYYRKSAELALHFKEKYLIHIAYPNLIDTYLLNGDNKNAVLFLGKYSNLIDKDNIDDLLRFNNYKLEYARQTRNRALHIEALVQGRIEILPKISAQKQLAFEISELRIRRSSECGWYEKLFWVRHSLPEYFKLEFPARYLALKEIFNILRELAKTNNLGPFVDLFSQLLDFMGRSKKDIDQYKFPDYCVDERCFWEKEKAFLRKVQKADEPQINLIDFYEGMFEHLRNIKDIQLQYGNHLQAIEADLNIADECMGVTQEIRDVAVIDYLRKNMQKHLDNACKDFEKFRRCPASNEYIVRIAKYALFLDDKERAREYFDDFVRSKISIYHYAPSIQQYYKELDNEFLGCNI
jgi:Ca2+/Na+ antiporter/RNA binding exosome subunit